MPDSIAKPASLQPWPWVIRREDFGRLETIVGKYSLKATIVEEEEGACFPIGAAEALIGEGTVGGSCNWR
jgi:hypothetical protein